MNPEIMIYGYRRPKGKEIITAFLCFMVGLWALLKLLGYI